MTSFVGFLLSVVNASGISSREKSPFFIDLVSSKYALISNEGASHVGLGFFKKTMEIYYLVLNQIIDLHCGPDADSNFFV